MKILVTGASGFVGGAVVRRLMQEGETVRAAMRRPAESLTPANFPAGVQVASIGDIGPNTDWTEAISGMDAVVHAAARVHMMRESAADPLEEFRRVNVSGTVALARACVAAGVRRFVYISSVKVNGERTLPGRPFRSGDAPAPVDPYGISKLEAEQALRAFAADGTLDVVIIRPVLVYGPGAKGNFLSMLRWLNAGVPLPFASLNNRRSMLALETLVDLIVLCLRHPAAPNHVFLAADGEDLSTPQLLRLTAAGLGQRARLIPFPASLLRAGAAVVGKSGLAERLCGSLQVDTSEARQVLSWVPPVQPRDALARAAEHFLSAEVDTRRSAGAA